MQLRRTLVPALALALALAVALSPFTSLQAASRMGPGSQPSIEHMTHSIQGEKKAAKKKAVKKKAVKKKAVKKAKKKPAKKAKAKKAPKSQK